MDGQDCRLPHNHFGTSMSTLDKHKNKFSKEQLQLSLNNLNYVLLVQSLEGRSIRKVALLHILHLSFWNRMRIELYIILHY